MTLQLISFRFCQLVKSDVGVYIQECKSWEVSTSSICFLTYCLLHQLVKMSLSVQFDLHKVLYILGKTPSPLHGDLLCF